MLLDIFVIVPSLLMTTIAWYIRVGLVLICLEAANDARTAGNDAEVWDQAMSLRLY